MSAHEPDSELSAINRFAHLRPVEVHDWTARVLERALYWASRSEGAFDPVRAGKAAVEHGLIPRHFDQPEPEASNWTSLELRGRAVRLLEPGCVDLGGIAKGFAVDCAVDALRSGGCRRGLANAGGDLRGFGDEPWPVTFVDPLERRPVAAVALNDQGAATSAGLPDASGGLSFAHLGGRHSRWTSVSVVTSTACDADALTKILWSHGIDPALLAAASAKALGIRHDSAVEDIGEAAEVAA